MERLRLWIIGVFPSENLTIRRDFEIRPRFQFCWERTPEDSNKTKSSAGLKKFCQRAFFLLYVGDNDGGPGSSFDRHPAYPQGHCRKLSRGWEASPPLISFLFLSHNYKYLIIISLLSHLIDDQGPKDTVATTYLVSILYHLKNLLYGFPSAVVLEPEYEIFFVFLSFLEGEY
jgi:hypothetical protein